MTPKLRALSALFGELEVLVVRIFIFADLLLHLFRR